MAWQEVFPLNESHRDAEEERELRLASQARAGAEWALSALVARYQPPVTRYLTRLTGDPEASRALAERIFVRMEKRLRGPQGGHHLRLWLLRACTETGLDTLRHPQRTRTALQLDGPRTAGLLPERAGEVAAGTLRAGLGALANLTGTTSRQVRQLIWSNDAEAPHREPKPAKPRDTSRANGKKQAQHPRMAPLAVEEDPAQQDPREALRYRMVRAVLAEIPYGDAQCLALHLIAGLNQAEVARALGITPSATRRRIVQGLQLFAQRYEAAAASLGLSMEALAPGTARTPPPVQAATPPRITQTPPVVAATTIPLPQAALEDAGPDPFEQQPMAAWDRPFEVMSRASAAPVEAVASVASVASVPPEPVTIDAVAAPDHYDPFASDEVDTLRLEEYAGPAVSPDEEKTLVIVETTAVVDAIPVAELPLEETRILNAPEAGAGSDMIALGFAAVEVPLRPPEPEPEPELVSAEEARPEAKPEDERVAPAAAMASSAPRAVRVVPVLTRPLEAPLGDDAFAPSDTPVAKKPAQEKPSPHLTQPALAVRIVPVLTPAVHAQPDPPPDAPPTAPIEHAGNGAAQMDAAGMQAEVDTADTAGDAYDTADATRETVVLAAGAPEGAPVEAQ